MAASDQSAESWTQNFVAGAAAGLAVRGLLFPVDTIKTNMQRSGTDFLPTVRTLLSRPSAFAALYRGLVPATFEVGVNRGALMGVSTAIKQMLPPDLPEVTRDATSGCVAGLRTCQRCTAVPPQHQQSKTTRRGMPCTGRSNSVPRRR